MKVNLFKKPETSKNENFKKEYNFSNMNTNTDYIKYKNL